MLGLDRLYGPGGLNGRQMGHDLLHPEPRLHRCNRLRVPYHGWLNAGGWGERVPISNHLHWTTKASMPFSISIFSAPPGAIPLCSNVRRIPHCSYHVSVLDPSLSPLLLQFIFSFSLLILLPSCLILMKLVVNS